MYVVFFFLYSTLHIVATFQELSLPNRLPNPEPMLLFSTMKSYPKTKVITQVLSMKWTSPQEFTNGTTGWRKKADAQMETKQRSEQSLCLLDFWTSTTPKSHLFKLKCEKVNRRSTLCKTWGHTRSVFYKCSASEAELQDQRFIGSSCWCF